MSRVINTENAGKERTRLSRAVVLAIRELMKQAEPDDASRDLAAFIVLALKGISQTIDSSVTAWEKRGYWVKADRFRMDWVWSEKLGNALEVALFDDDWGNIAQVAVQVAQKLSGVRVPDRHRMGTPWVGAWDQLHSIHRG